MKYAIGVSNVLMHTLKFASFSVKMWVGDCS